MPSEGLMQEAEVLDQEIAGLDALDALDVSHARPTSRAGRIWGATWPKLMAMAMVIAAWQAVVWTGWKPAYVFPGPGEVLPKLGGIMKTADFRSGLLTTLQRGAIGFAIAIAIGTAIGVAVSRSAILRRAFGSFITGLQSMPSIVWFPFAIILFKLSESAILFVVVLGAAPSVANGLVSGIDTIPPLLLRAGRVLGANGYAKYRHVVIPAALPGYVAGLKQGWAFAWRSLMAGELIVVIAQHQSVGTMLDNFRQLQDMQGVMAMMIVVLLIGVLIDDVVFGTIERRMRHRRGLMEPA